MTEVFLTIFTEINSRTQQYVTDNSIVDIAEDLSIQFDSLPNFERKIVGKVRDVYICKDCIVLVTSNRQSAFDRLLCSIPSKGKVFSLK
jgi:phosphoribosylaminoimidazole-succinocarboxamide synthase